jgi:hypothetical protein
MNWIQSCTNSGISVERSGLIVYAIELELGDGDTIPCLLSGREANAGIPVSDGEAVVTYLSPIDVVILGDGPRRQMPEALIQSDNKALIVSAVESDRGITRIIHVSSDVFIVQSGYSTHDRAYLVLAHSGRSSYLTNGEVEVVDREKLLFRVKDYKSYFRSGGAYWFDAIIDHDGNILDIVTPAEDKFAKCMSREELAGKASLDLSRMPTREVCIRR